MHDGSRCAAQRLEGACDELGARLREHLNRDVLGNEVAFDELAHEVEIGLRSGREPDFDLLEADSHQQLEHAALALGVHRLDQRLIAVAQIDAAPDRRCADHFVRPRAIGQIHGSEWAVLGRRYLQHADEPRLTNQPENRSGLEPERTTNRI